MNVLLIQTMSMVTKEQLVCTAEQSAVLRQKGCPQNTIFMWQKVHDKMYGGYMNILDDNFGDGLAAYTTAELMELLPRMNWLKKLLFIWRTNLDPQEVAEYLIERL